MDRKRQKLEDLAYQMARSRSMKEVQQIKSDMDTLQRQIKQDEGAQRHRSDPSGRRVDIADIEGRMATASPARRQQLREAANRIRNESPKVRDMRRQLVQATRDGDRDKVQEIHDFVKSHPTYQ